MRAEEGVDPRAKDRDAAPVPRLPVGREPAVVGCAEGRSSKLLKPEGLREIAILVPMPENGRKSDTFRSPYRIQRRLSDATGTQQHAGWFKNDSLLMPRFAPVPSLRRAWTL